MISIKIQKVMVTNILLNKAGSFVNNMGQTVDYVSRKISGLCMSDPEKFHDIVMKYPEQLNSVVSSLNLGDVLDFECKLVFNKDGNSASFLISDIFKSGHSLLTSGSLEKGGK